MWERTFSVSCRHAGPVVCSSTHERGPTLQRDRDPWCLRISAMSVRYHISLYIRVYIVIAIQGPIGFRGIKASEGSEVWALVGVRIILDLGAHDKARLVFFGEFPGSGSSDHKSTRRQIPQTHVRIRETSKF